MKCRSILVSVLAAALLICVAGCQKETATVFPGEDETYSEELATLGVSNRFAGVVCASGETKVEKDESKAVAKIKVEAGDIVKKGQLLFTYDSEQAQLNYDKASLELEQLRYTLQSHEDQKAQLEREKAAAAQSEQLSYTLQIQEADTNIRETSYNIKVKEKEVEKLQKGLKNLKVKSPVSGKIQSINADGSTDMEGSSMPFIVIMNTGTYRVKAYINEVNAMELYQGANVIVRSRTDDSTWTGKVTTVDFENPAGSQQGFSEDIAEVSSSSKYPFYVELDNADGLMLGQHVYVEVVDVEFSSPVVSEEGDEESGMDDGGMMPDMEAGFDEADAMGPEPDVEMELPEDAGLEAEEAPEVTP